MPGRKKRTNPVLFLITLLLCLILGVLLSGSSANRSPLGRGTQPDMFVAKDAGSSKEPLDGTVTNDNPKDELQTEEDTPQPTDTPIPTEPATVNKEAIKASEVSSEASNGVWTPSGSNWMFLVDGVPYTGWLTDLDQHRYFFNEEGIMQTGWLDDGGKRYYLDLDGIMQTGKVTIDEETYEFLEDGSLKGYAPDAAPSVQAQEENSQKSADTKKKTDAESSAKEDNTEKTASDSNKKASIKGQIALTFDDGPSSFTSRLLDCLEANNAKATFFLVGEEASYFQEEVKRIAALGCELGNHTYSHADLTSLDAEGIVSEISRTDQLLTELTGQASTALRPPYGSINDQVSATVTTPMFLWSVDTRDWETLDAQKTIDSVLSEAKDGAIILMHDIYSETVDAAEVIIPKLIQQGYELVTVHELAASKGIDLQAGIAYTELSGNVATN